MPSHTDHTNAHFEAYAQRMNKVLDHIDRQLDQRLDLAALAEVAHFSAFHFHRIFVAWMDETPGDYLSRRRLDVAALTLSHQPSVSVLDVAVSVGFGSGEAFARAFKSRFGCTPSGWRNGTAQRWAQDLAQNSNLDQAVRLGKGNDGTDHDTRFEGQPIAMNISIQTLPPVRAAYMRHIGPYGPSVARFWQEAFLPWRDAHGLGHATCFGIGHDDPFITSPEKCRCDACVEVPADFKVLSPASVTTLPGGRYAVARYQGNGTDIAYAWTRLMREWLPSSGMQVDSRPFFERYEGGAKRDQATGVFECTLCMPVKPL